MFANKTHESAHTALKEGKIDKSIELYTKALKGHEKDPNIYSDRGVAYLHKNDQVRCYEDLNKAIELQPNYAYRYACLAFAKNNFGDIDGAIIDYEKAVKLDPTDAVAENNLGLLLEQKGYKQKAEERFAKADKLSKMEDHLYEVMDEIEGEGIPRKKEEENIINQKMIDPSEKREEYLGQFGEFKKVFTSKKQFKEFVAFIKNGFKIK